MRATSALYLLLLAAWFLVSCDQLQEATVGDAAVTPTAEPVAPQATVAPPRVPVLSTPSAVAPTAATLRVWLPPDIAAPTDAGAQALADQLFAYDVSQDNVNVVVAQKEVSGPGGLLAYLRTGRDVAPAILPDLIAIPAELLPVLAGESLIFPLDEQLDDDALAGLFPAAETMAQPQASLLGLPFIMTQLPHLAYNSNVLTDTLPLTWERLIADDDRSMVFAADGPQGAVLALQFYLDAGGQVFDADGQPLLQLDPLVTALQQIEDGRAEGFFAQQSSSVSSTELVWQVFLSGGANIAHTQSDHYLEQTIAGLPVSFTVIPGLDRPLTPLVSGWAWAVTATDPQQQALAAGLLQELASPANLGEWSAASKVLPANRDALALWPTDDPYIGFARQELERAQALPVSTSGRILTVLGDAVFQVVSGEKLAEEAAADAVAAING